MKGTNDIPTMTSLFDSTPEGSSYSIPEKGKKKFKLFIPTNSWHGLHLLFRIATGISFAHYLPTVTTRNSFLGEKRTLRCTGSPELSILNEEKPHRHQDEEECENTEGQKKNSHLNLTCVKDIH